MTVHRAKHPSVDAEAEAWCRFIAAWWDRFRDEEVCVDDLLAVALDVQGLNLGWRWSGARTTKLGGLLGRHRAHVVHGHRITPNRLVRGVQMWRLLRAEPMAVGASVEVTGINEFSPSDDWQVVPDGFPCPPGGEFRINLQTGVTLGRWPGLAQPRESN